MRSPNVSPIDRRPSRTPRTTNLWGLLAVIAFGMTLSACGGGGDGGGSNPSTSAPSGTVPADSSQSMVRLSGTISVAEFSAVDSDTNDPAQSGFRSNDSLATAQSLPNPVFLSGHLNVPGQGPTGRTFVSGDVLDAYRINLQAGQVVELAFGADIRQMDVDLAVLDENGEIVGLSYGLSSYECVFITRSGSYFVVPVIFDRTAIGSTNYVLFVAPPAGPGACANRTVSSAGVIGGEVVAAVSRSSDTQRALKAIDSSGMTVVGGGLEPGSLALLKLPTNTIARTKGLDALAERAAQERGMLSRPVSKSLADFSLRLPSATSEILETVAYAKLLGTSGGYEHVSPNRVMESTQAAAFVGALPSSDPEYAKQRWHYDQISLPSAMTALQQMTPQPTRRPIVAVLDTGVVLDHPDLSSQLLPGFDFVSSLSFAGDGDGIDAVADDVLTPSSGVSDLFHGTHVSGTIAASTFNAVGGASVAPMAQILPIRVLGRSGRGNLFDYLEGLKFSAGLANASGRLPSVRADIVNLSLGGTGTCDALEQSVINEVRRQGVSVVAAAGNDSSASVPAPLRSPANCAGVIAVGATNSRLERAVYSNVGAALVVAAPGGDSGDQVVHSTVATFNGGVRQPTYAGLPGTSMAAPHVAGVVALMKWVNPALTPSVIDGLLASGALTTDIGDVGRDAAFGWGLINARKAVDAALASVGQPIPGGAIEVQPAFVAMGSIRTRAELLVVAIGPTSDRVVAVSADSAQLLVSPKPGAVDATTGLGTYVVTANRDAIAPGASVTPKVLVQRASGLTTEVPVSFERRAPGIGAGDYGPLYVLAFDVDDPDFKLLGKVSAEAPAAGLYRYSLSVPKGKRVFVLAGSDLNNDQEPCSWAEACGAYPILGIDIARIDTSVDRTGIDFSVSPFLGLDSVTSAPPDSKPPTAPAAPSLSITDSVPGSVANGPVTFFFTFSTAVTGFDLLDVTVTGGTSGVLSGSGTSFALTVTPPASTTGQIVVTVRAGAAVDSAGRANATPVSASQAYQVGALAAPTITSPTVSSLTRPTISGGATPGVTILLTVDAANNGSVDATYSTVASPSGSWAVNLAVASPSSGGIGGGLVNGSTNGLAVRATDTAGNTSSTTTSTIRIDTSIPSGPVIAAIEGDNIVNIAEAADGVVVSGTIGEAGRPVTVTWGAASQTVTAVGTGWSASFAAGQVPPTGVSTLRASFVNLAGTTSAETTRDVTIDRVAPAGPVVTDNVAGATATGPVTFTFTFAEPMAAGSFTAADVQVAGGAPGAFAGSGASYTLLVTPTPDVTGTITVTVPAGSATDVAGNPTTSAGAGSQAFDSRVAPTVVITDPVSGTANGPVTFTFAFSEPVTGFTSGDIVTTAAVSGFTAVSTSVYTAVLTPPAGSGTFTVAVLAGAAQDIAGNASVAAIQVSQAYAPSDVTPPTVTITDPVSSTANGPVTFTFTWSEPVTGFTLSDITVGGASGGATLGTFSGSGATYTAVYSPAAGTAGTLTLSVGPGVVTDAALNANTGMVGHSQAYDRVAPTVIITDSASGTASGPVTFTFTFSEPVTGFTAGDIVTTAAVSGFATINSSVYTAVLTTPVGSGVYTVTVAGGAAVDIAGNVSIGPVSVSQPY
jgi:serine protease